MRHRITLRAAVAFALAVLVIASTPSAGIAQDAEKPDQTVSIVQADLNGDYLCNILDSRGKVWCQRNWQKPPRVVRIPDRIQQIADNCGRTAAGRVWCWSSDGRYVVRKRVAATIASLGDSGPCGLSTRDQIWCWSAYADSDAYKVSEQRFSRVAAGYTVVCGVSLKGAGLTCITQYPPDDIVTGSEYAVEMPRPVELSIGDRIGCGRTSQGRLWCFGDPASDFGRPEPSRVVPGIRRATSMAVSDSWSSDSWGSVCVSSRRGDLMCTSPPIGGSLELWQRGGVRAVAGGSYGEPCAIVGDSVIRCWSGPGDSYSLPRPWLRSGRK